MTDTFRSAPIAVTGDDIAAAIHTTPAGYNSAILNISIANTSSTATTTVTISINEDETILIEKELAADEVWYLERRWGLGQDDTLDVKSSAQDVVGYYTHFTFPNE
ncbi:MAG: hypothetical protein PsegKO_33060 [Pseudohongiellaceae bacterium]